jgi:two-component system sensor histidine kinase/response regulator
LVADDNVVNQRLLERLLEKQGHRVTLVGTGKRAVELTAERAFDLVLMDLQMPEMDGFEATAAIRARDADARHLPLVAVTAHAMPGDRERCLDAGFDGYLSKPVDVEDLLELIDALVPRPSARDTLESAPDDVLDMGLALARAGGDAELSRELAALFVSELPGWRKAIDEAVAAGSAAALRIAAHTLKGAASNCGAKLVCDASERLERAGREEKLEGVAELHEALLAELAKLLPRLDEYARSKP